MTHVVQTEILLAEGILTRLQADEIIKRSRETMIALTVNIVLCAGILSAALGLVFWLADPVTVAIAGGVFLAAGLLVLLKTGPLYRMIGHAAALIGAGLWIAGGTFELLDTLEEASGPILLVLGGLIAAGCALVYERGPQILRFPIGATFLMAGAVHLTGLGVTLTSMDAFGLPMALAYLYSAALIASGGVWLNVRTVTALAIVPFAQMLDTGTAYFHAAYVFYSPEPAFTILQMLCLAAACLYALRQQPDRIARHGRILAMMAIVVMNLAFLVGSLWGDYPGEALMFADRKPSEMTWTAYHALKQEWRDAALHISEHVFSVIWAVALLAGALWAAHGARRAIFNAAVTFGAIHAYTQTFESLDNVPLAFAILGLTAVPLAWGVWRWNERLSERGETRQST